MRSARRVAGATAAFTLIEMMMVVVIIVVLVGVTMPTFVRTYRSEVLRSEARMLMSTFQQARYQAIVRQHPMTLNLNLDEQAYWIEASIQTVTNLTLQVFAMSTNSMAIATNFGPVTTADDLSTNEAVNALPTWTRRDMTSGVRLEQVQTAEGDVIANGVATVTCYPNGASEGGLVLLRGSANDFLGVEVDPLTSLPKLILDAQPK